MTDLFERVDYAEDQELDKAIEKTGHNIKDVKAVIMGHLHIDHAGGLDYFRGTDVPIWVHETELKHAFYSVLTKTDLGMYQYGGPGELEADRIRRIHSRPATP